MLIHIPTMFVAIAALGATLFLSVGWVSRWEDHDGLKPMTYGLALHTLGYVLFLVGNGLIVVVLRNFVITAAFGMLIFSITEFYGYRPARFILYLPAPLTAALCALYFDNLMARIALATLVLVLLDLVLLYYLFLGRKQNTGRAQYLVIAGVVLNLLVLAARGVALLTQTLQVQNITDASLAQSLVYVSAFVSLNLVAVGFVLMTKEAADETNRLLASKDKLTNCWNRRKLEELAQQEILRQRRYNSPLSVMLIDIDYFKQINDTQGHLQGDQVLKQVAQQIECCIRETDTLARWGGEEFVVLLPSSDLATSYEIAERVRSQVAHALGVTVSVGLAACRSEDAWSDWFARADAALYSAKRDGRDRVACAGVE